MILLELSSKTHGCDLTAFILLVSGHSSDKLHFCYQFQVYSSSKFIAKSKLYNLKGNLSECNFFRMFFQKKNIIPLSCKKIKFDIKN